MKKILRLAIVFLLISPLIGRSQCTSTNATTCQCPPGGGTNCDLLPDISIAKSELTLPGNYTEYAQVCSPSCSGNDGRLRIGVSTPIIGYGPLQTHGTSRYLCGTDTLDAGSVNNIPATCPTTGLPPRQLINQRIFHKSNNAMTTYDRPAGTMTYHPSHGHQHVDEWGVYTLRTNNGDPNPVNWPIIGTGAKLGFCLLDIKQCQNNPGYCTDSLGNSLNSSNIPNYGLNGLPNGTYSCSNSLQGITNGWMDTYSQSLDGMWINLPPGLCNGTYWVVVQIDPLNYFLETNEKNNVVAVPITLTKQSSAPAITANGPTSFCQGGSVTLTASASSNYLWSTGAVTQSIVVSTGGTYTVSATCGATSSTSPPVVVTIIPITVNVSTSPTVPLCNGDSVQLSSSAVSTGYSNVPVVFSNSTPLFIPDAPAAAVNSPITVSGINPATLSSSSVVSVNLNLTHTYDGDLTISLLSPSGNSVLLSNRRGGGGNNFLNTVFSMSAVTLISSGAAPFTGSYKPDGNLSTFTENANGLWQLRVQDLGRQDTGRIQNWSLTINTQVTETFNYAWSSIPAGFNSSMQNPVAHPTASATYSVTATSNATGCSGTNSTAVNVFPQIAINAFAPLTGGTGTVVTINGLNFSNVTNVTVGGIPVSSFTVINANQIQVVVPNVGNLTGPFCMTNSTGCSGCSGTTFTINQNPTIVLNLKLFIEGLYLGNGQMSNVLYQHNQSTNPNATDSIAVELHYPDASLTLAGTTKSILHKDGTASLAFPSSLLGQSYFIAVRNRNSIETWSKTAVPFLVSPMSFDFTTP